MRTPPATMKFFLTIAFVLSVHAAVNSAGTTFRGSATPLRFLSVGDWGGQETPPYYTQVQKNVAKQMGIKAAATGTTFNFGLGDNFYSHGINCENDPSPDCTTDVTSHRFKDTFEDVYSADSLQNPWYILAGNHDHLGNVTAQIDYSNHSKRWNFPDYFYTFTETTTGGATVQFVMIDTVILAGEWKPEYTGVHMQPQGRNIEASLQGFDWIETTLSNSKADWLIVCGHYPVWSIAEHGPTAQLVDQLKPMLEKHNVAFYLNGHDHNLQHLNDGSVVEYIDCGAGHDADETQTHLKDCPKGSSKFFNKGGGFIYVEVTDNVNAVVDFVTETGDHVYQIKKTNPRKQQ